MFLYRRQKKQLLRALRQASDYAEWLDAAEALDRLEHRLDWIQDPRSPWFDNVGVAAKTAEFISCREQEDPLRLMLVLEEALSQYHNDVINPRLYGETYTGENKAIASTFLREAAASLYYLADAKREGFDLETKLQLFETAFHKYGRSALMLSGGGTLGIYHFGVVKALYQQDLLPTVMAGSSMGAIVAAGLSTRTRAELDDFLSTPEAVQRQALKLKKLRKILAEASLFDPQILLKHIRANIGGDLTFAEAFAKTGWNLNISVSPVRSRQKPRILNYLSSPDLLIAQSTLVSCSMPFLYPPGMLWARDRDGHEHPYQPEERWMDGTMASDLPMARVSRLHNVNHYIVSQTNPHVYFFVGRSDKPSIASMGLEMVASMGRAQLRATLDSARKLTQSSSIGPMFAQLHSLSDQPYLGDINIHPKSDPLLLRKILANPSQADLKMFIREGERVTWPKFAMIRDQTLISRSFEKIIAQLRAQLRDKTASPAAVITPK